MDKITVQIATIPERTLLLKLVVHSLLNQVDQVDQLNVMLNGHKLVPDFLNHPRITYHFMDNSKGDAAKFYQLRGVKGYIFTCDDDLVYPHDYTRVMISKLKEYDNKVILTNHGRIMLPKPVDNAYTNRRIAFHCLDAVDYGYELDVGGSGVMAWHSDCFFPDIDKIDKRNMADIWIHGFAKEQGVKIMLNPHKEGWIKYLQPENTIWDYAFNFPEEMTKLYNSF
jgi:hypothetical protein